MGSGQPPRGSHASESEDVWVSQASQRSRDDPTLKTKNRMKGKEHPARGIPRFRPGILAILGINLERDTRGFKILFASIILSLKNSM